MAMASSVTRELFGGAITALFPGGLVDASDLRQVPDNQEVFLYPDSSISIIVEILQMVQPQNDIDAIKFHFDSLANDNSAQSFTIHDTKVIPSYAGIEPNTATILEGTQFVPKFRRADLDEVRMLMVLYRIASKNTDLVVTWNVPLKADGGGAVGEEGLTAAKSDVERFVSSFQIRDFGLFA